MRIWVSNVCCNSDRTRSNILWHAPMWFPGLTTECVWALPVEIPHVLQSDGKRQLVVSSNVLFPSSLSFTVLPHCRISQHTFKWIKNLKRPKYIIKCTWSETPNAAEQKSILLSNYILTYPTVRCLSTSTGCLSVCWKKCFTHNKTLVLLRSGNAHHISHFYISSPRHIYMFPTQDCRVTGVA